MRASYELVRMCYEFSTIFSYNNIVFILVYRISLHIHMYVYRPSNCCFFSLLGPLWVLSQPCRSCSCVVSCHVFMKLFYEQIQWWWIFMLILAVGSRSPRAALWRLWLGAFNKFGFGPSIALLSCASFPKFSRSGNFLSRIWILAHVKNWKHYFHAFFRKFCLTCAVDAIWNKKLSYRRETALHPV